jgi:hypothetical protein
LCRACSLRTGIGDAKQRADEVLKMRRQRDEQFRLGLAVECGGGQARRKQPLAQVGVDLAQGRQKSAVDLFQSGEVVKLLEFQPESQQQPITRPVHAIAIVLVPNI